MSPLVRQRSRTASSWTVGMRTLTSSPARCSRASRRQSRRSVSGLVARRLGDQRRGDHLAAHVQAVQQPGQLEAGRSGLVAGSQAAGVAEAANEPADGCLVVGNPLDVWDLLVGRQDPDRDGVLVDIQAEMDRREVRDTGHGRLLPYGGSARPSVGDPRRCGPEPAVPCWLRTWRSCLSYEPDPGLPPEEAVRPLSVVTTLRPMKPCVVEFDPGKLHTLLISGHLPREWACRVSDRPGMD